MIINLKTGIEVDDEEILEKIAQVFSPEDVFTYDALSDWATENGFEEV